MGWTAWIGDDLYAVRFLWGLLGNLFLAFGIYWQAASKTIVQPGEGMVLAFSVVLRKSFGTIKIWNDVTLVLLAVILGFVFLGHVAGVREGVNCPQKARHFLGTLLWARRFQRKFATKFCCCFSRAHALGPSPQGSALPEVG